MNDDTRLLLWEALSELFLDTEVTDTTVRCIAQVVAQSGVPVPEVEAVLWNDVFPVLYPNLLSVAGEWAGWPREWLREHLQPARGPARRKGPRILVRDIEAQWNRVLAQCNTTR
ncbi:hypothetical protein P3W24_05375 [Luteibacter sp. PPL201]|uniref:DUF7079 domain-containing protein n=1 Tax=Luteibacter sahnii TaxID=3021977 RepID=A0ABT6B8I1_9GAMM|nr:hypothetical protein [Luteibacter sp. PPL193]MDY1550029.1 hypothetical protein [Luteibacter sp. PPL193]